MFSRQDLEFLIECVDAKLACESQGTMMAEMFGAMLGPRDVDEEEYKAAMKQRMRDAAAKRKPLEDRCTLLKAKLIQLRDSADADALLHSAQE